MTKQEREDLAIRFLRELSSPDVYRKTGEEDASTHPRFAIEKVNRLLIKHGVSFDDLKSATQHLIETGRLWLRPDLNIGFEEQEPMPKTTPKWAEDLA